MHPLLVAPGCSTCNGQTNTAVVCDFLEYGRQVLPCVHTLVCIHQDSQDVGHAYVSVSTNLKHLACVLLGADKPTKINCMANMRNLSAVDKHLWPVYVHSEHVHLCADFNPQVVSSLSCLWCAQQPCNTCHADRHCPVLSKSLMTSQPIM